jgi:hypothetical protein
MDVSSLVRTGRRSRSNDRGLSNFVDFMIQIENPFKKRSSVHRERTSRVPLLWTIFQPPSCKSSSDVFSRITCFPWRTSCSTTVRLPVFWNMHSTASWPSVDTKSEDRRLLLREADDRIDAGERDDTLGDEMFSRDSSCSRRVLEVRDMFH